MLVELRKVIPAFLTRVDLPDRGGAWSEYLAETRERTADGRLPSCSGRGRRSPGRRCRSSSSIPRARTKIVAAAMYPHADLPDGQLLEVAPAMPADERSLLRAAVGDRATGVTARAGPSNATVYRFDVLCDYGAFRDLQRHRLLTIEWQRLTPDHGFERHRT